MNELAKSVRVQAFLPAPAPVVRRLLAAWGLARQLGADRDQGEITAFGNVQLGATEFFAAIFEGHTDVQIVLAPPDDGIFTLPEAHAAIEAARTSLAAAGAQDARIEEQIEFASPIEGRLDLVMTQVIRTSPEVPSAASPIDISHAVANHASRAAGTH